MLPGLQSPASLILRGILVAMHLYEPAIGVGIPPDTQQRLWPSLLRVVAGQTQSALSKPPTLDGDDIETHQYLLKLASEAQLYTLTAPQKRPQASGRLLLPLG